MPYFDGMMSDSRFRVRLHLNQNSQDWNANTTSVGWAVEIVKVGSSFAFSSNPSYWSVNINGWTASGSFTYNFGSYSSLVVGSGAINIAHSPSGYLTVSGSAAVNADSPLGSGSTSGAFSPSRIPKVPDAPTPVGIDETTATSFRYRFSGNSDNGSGILEWQAQTASNSGYTTDVQTVSSGGTTTFTGLTPGKTYWARSRGRNAMGWGPWSSDLSVSIGLPAPATFALTQNASGSLIGTWTAPSVTTGLTGYRFQISSSPSFTTGVWYTDTGNVLTGSISGPPGGVLYYGRVAAITAGGVNSYSASDDHLLVLADGDLDGWTRVGTKPSQISSFTSSGLRRGTSGSAQALWVESLSTGSVTLAANTYGIQKTITGLTVGKAYQYTAKATLNGAPLATSYKLNVVSETAATPVTVTTSVTDLGLIEFIADSTSATIQILLAASVPVTGAVNSVERVAFTNMRLTELDTDYPERLRGTVYESDLANHFDLACNSVGASWGVGKDGVTRFRLPGTALPTSAVFTDSPIPGAVSYVDIVAGYDTRSTVNYIEATNYGVDPAGENEQNDTLIVQDTGSMATYGVYRSNIAMNLYSEVPYDESFSDRLDELIEGHNTPLPTVSQIKWNAQEDLDRARELDAGQRITVRYRGADYDSQIVAIQHDITPTRWLVTLDLQQL